MNENIKLHESMQAMQALKDLAIIAGASRAAMNIAGELKKLKKEGKIEKIPNEEQIEYAINRVSTGDTDLNCFDGELLRESAFIFRNILSVAPDVFREFLKGNV